MTIGEKLLSVVTSIANCLKNHDGRIGALEEGGGGSIDTSEFVKKTDIAVAGGDAGLVKIAALNYGVEIVGANNCLRIQPPTQTAVDNRSGYNFNAVTLGWFDRVLKASITTNTETLTTEEQAAATEWLGAIPKKLGNYKIPYTDGTGEIKTNYSWTSAATPYTFPLRREGGQIMVGDPTFDGAATPKSYVDGLVGGIETALDSIIAIQEELIGVPTIAFTVGGAVETVECQAERGMTWGAWLESEYCPTDNFKASGSGVSYYKTGAQGPSGGVAIAGKFVKLTDPIIDNGAYVVTTSAEL